MIKQDFDKLELITTNISIALKELSSKLYKILSTEQKNFTCIFKGKKFEFHPPSTKGEAKALDRRRKKFIKLLLKYVMTNVTKELFKDNCENKIEILWEPVLAFAQGVDPLDQQLDKVEIKKMRDESSIVAKKYNGSIPLDLDSYYGKVQAGVRNEIAEEIDRYRGGYNEAYANKDVE